LAGSDAAFRLFQLTPDDDGQTLAAVLKRLVPCSSWGEAKKLIGGRRVQLNGNLCLDPARRLTVRDSLKVWKDALPKPVDAEAIRFVHIDDDLVIIEKPPRITSARHYEERHLRHRRRQLQPTLEEMVPRALARELRWQRFTARQSLDSPQPRAPRPAAADHISPREQERIEAYAAKLKIIAVHRLDRDTSGLMIFARNQQTAERLGKLFRAHAIDRRYQAVVIGHPSAQTLESYLIRDRGDGHRGSAPPPYPEDAQHAVTHIRPLEVIGDYTIIECKLETGRTHQIRIHLAEAGHPLCGETIYHKTLDGRLIDDRSQAPRQALHSSALRLVHPVSGQILKFQSSWPADLEAWLRRLRRASGRA
jgi:23S rRNA pseudouridine1911/1915/1917 synthase